MARSWKQALKAGGLGTVAAYVLVTLYSRFLKLPVFARLTSSQTYVLLLLFLVLVFLALVVLVYAYRYTTKVRTLPRPPSRLPNGNPFRRGLRTRFTNLWISLVDLESAAKALWLEVSPAALRAFADKLADAQKQVASNGLFFDEADFARVERLLDVADFYFDGKRRLLSLRDEASAFRELFGPQRGEVDNEAIRSTVEENEKWLEQYKALLRDLRRRLREAMAA